MMEALAGFGGAVLGAAVSALVVWRVARSDRAQRDAAADADRAQRHRAARKDQWWSRTQWAFDLVLQDSGRARTVGWRVLNVLGSSEWADVRELRIITAAAHALVRRVDDGEEPEDNEDTGGEQP